MAETVTQQSLENAYRRIERDALQHSEAQERPHAILLGGQPGSGKSFLAHQAESDLRDKGGSIVIDADRMREENPRYQQLSKKDPLNAVDRTHKEAGQWAQRLTQTAVEERRNLVIDGTMRNPEAIQELASRLQGHGYSVEARVMAVDAETSMIRSRLRFEEQVEARGTGRFVNREQHDNAYEGIPKSVDSLERSRVLDNIKLYDSAHRVVYENTQERGEWKHPAAAAPSMEQVRSREWTHAERSDYVATLEKINELAQTREGTRDNITYRVGTTESGAAIAYKNAYEAAQAFRDAKVEDRPYVHQVAALSDGRESVTTVAQTTTVTFQDETRFGKTVNNVDEPFKRAFENGNEFRAGTADLELLASKLEAARADLARFEKSDIYQRAQSFDTLPATQALKRHPELDGAIKHLQDLNQGLPSNMPPEQRETLLAAAREALSEQLHRGEIPKGNVSRDESLQYINAAAEARGYALVRDAGELKRDVQGEVVAMSSHHVLMQTSSLVAVRVEKSSIDRDVQPGETMTVLHGRDKGLAHNASPDQARPAARDASRDMER